MATPVARADPSPGSRLGAGSGPAIEAVDLVKRYGEITAVAGVTFHVTPGQIFGCLGRNGSGKTTTVRMLTTLTRPSSGTATVAGYHIDDARQVRSRIGVTMQEAALDPSMTATEHLRLIARLWGMRKVPAAARADHLLEAFGLADDAGRRIGGFSTGMQRRLDIATALISDPSVLFLDEPSTGLDPQSRRALWAYIRQLRDTGTTVFLTTQYLEEADELADQVAIVDHGTIIAQGTPSGLKHKLGHPRISLDHDGDPNAIRRAVPEMQVDIDQHGRTVISLDSGVASSQVLAVLDRIRAAELDVHNLAVSGASLEEVFVRLTGSDIATRQDQLPTEGPS